MIKQRDKTFVVEEEKEKPKSGPVAVVAIGDGVLVLREHACPIFITPTGETRTIENFGTLVFGGEKP